MPYIRKELRPSIDDYINPLITRLDNKLKNNEITEKELAGCLTYIIFKLIRHYYESGNWYSKSDAIKICDSAVDEFRRRFIHKHEEDAIARNGDVI